MHIHYDCVTPKSFKGSIHLLDFESKLPFADTWTDWWDALNNPLFIIQTHLSNFFLLQLLIMTIPKLDAVRLWKTNLMWLVRSTGISAFYLSHSDNTNQDAGQLRPKIEKRWWFFKNPCPFFSNLCTSFLLWRPYQSKDCFFFMCTMTTSDLANHVRLSPRLQEAPPPRQGAVWCHNDLQSLS